MARSFLGVGWKPGLFYQMCNSSCHEFELNGSSFNRYKDDQLKAGETRKQKFELYIPHDGTEKPVVRLFENDATISHTICVNILISALIEGYKNYKKSNPEFKHDFSHIWFEG